MYMYILHVLVHIDLVEYLGVLNLPIQSKCFTDCGAENTGAKKYACHNII